MEFSEYSFLNGSEIECLSILHTEVLNGKVDTIDLERLKRGLRTDEARQLADDIVNKTGRWNLAVGLVTRKADSLSSKE